MTSRGSVTAVDRIAAAVESPVKPVAVDVEEQGAQRKRSIPQLRPEVLLLIGSAVQKGG